MTEQDKFEAVIKAPPYEHTCAKYTNKTLRPSEYSNYETLLAWHIWEECAEQKQAEIDALRKELEQVKMREAEIIAQAKEEQREADAIVAENITAFTQYQTVWHYKFSRSIAEAIRNKKE